MKKILFLILFTIVLSACNKNDDYTSSSPLPPATQTGKNMLACKVDGKSFIHKGSLINCFYQYIDGEYYFAIQGKNRDLNPSSISVGFVKNLLIEGSTYQLIESGDNNATGTAFFRS